MHFKKFYFRGKHEKSTFSSVKGHADSYFPNRKNKQIGWIFPSPLFIEISEHKLLFFHTQELPFGSLKAGPAKQKRSGKETLASKFQSWKSPGPFESLVHFKRWDMDGTVLLLCPWTIVKACPLDWNLTVALRCALFK